VKEAALSFVHFPSARMARLVARALGGGSSSVHDVAARMTETDLDAFPPADLAETEEHNALAFDPLWRARDGVQRSCTALA
jgi:hypothetical protein